MNKRKDIDIEIELENFKQNLDSIKLIKGKIKWFSIEKGFGYIFGEDGKSYFFHIADVKDVRLPKLKDSVLFEPVVNEKNSNKKAINITFINTEEETKLLPEENENFLSSSNDPDEKFFRKFSNKKDKIDIDIKPPIITSYPGLKNPTLIKKTFLKIAIGILFAGILSATYYIAVAVHVFFPPKEQDPIPIFLKNIDKENK